MRDISRSNQFKGKVAIVTGASRGIGLSIAQTLARRGAAVALNYPNDDEAARAHNLVAEIVGSGGRAIAVKADVRNLREIVSMFDAAIATYAALDFVVSNAGGPVAASTIGECSENLFDAATAFNAKSAFFVLQHAARLLRDGGRVIAISSSTTSLTQAGLAPYAGAKAAVEAYCRVLAKELGSRSITVNSVSPGLTETDGMRASNLPAERIEAVKAITPLGRLGTAQDIADVVMMLLSDDAHWITGQHISAGGGAFH